jgi:hypothetical protein
VAAALEFLSAEWVERYRAAGADLPERPGVTARVEHVVTGTEDGDVGWWATFVDGRVVDAGRHELASDVGALVAGSVGADAPPLVTVTMPLSLAVAIASGDVEPAVAFMQGRAKVAGDQAALLRVLALSATPEYRVAARTVERATRR